jgi:hypothetical protein
MKNFLNFGHETQFCGHGNPGGAMRPMPNRCLLLVCAVLCLALASCGGTKASISPDDKNSLNADTWMPVDSVALSYPVPYNNGTWSDVFYEYSKPELMKMIDWSDFSPQQSYIGSDSVYHYFCAPTNQMSNYSSSCSRLLVRKKSPEDDSLFGRKIVPTDIKYYHKHPGQLVDLDADDTLAVALGDEFFFPTQRYVLKGFRFDFSRWPWSWNAIDPRFEVFMPEEEQFSLRRKHFR